MQTHRQECREVSYAQAKGREICITRVQTMASKYLPAGHGPGAVLPLFGVLRSTKLQLVHAQQIWQLQQKLVPGSSCR